MKRSVVALAAMLCLLPPAWAAPADTAFTAMVSKFVLLPSGKPETEVLAKASTAVSFIQRMELPQASRAINEALQLAPGNTQLHFLNAFIYHLQAKQGDSQKNEMAIEGYQQALRIDPANWIAQEFLGLALLDHGRFADAKLQFSEVLMMTPDSTVSINGLMTASYLTGDAVTACLMADQLGDGASLSPGMLRSTVAVYASCGQFAKAQSLRGRLTAAPQEADRLDRRVAQWKSFYDKQAPLTGGAVIQHANLSSTTAKVAVMPAQAFTVPKIPAPRPVANTPPPAAPAAPATAAAAAANAAAEPAATAAAVAAPAPVKDGDAGPRMVLVDVVLVSMQDQVSTSKGVNLLSALTLQLGSVAGNLAAFSRAVSSIATTNAPGSTTTTITRAVTVPALSYSLNIANASNAINEVLARPTLAAIEGMPSEFFSGTNLSAGVVSASTQGGTTIVPLEKRFGIKLAVTPLFLANDRVQLKVEAQRTSLTASVDNPRVAYQIESGEITANANVVMALGDTLVLSGLTEKSSTQTRDGVPVLQDVPGVQYLFSNKKTNDLQRSVLMLITPRAPAYTARGGVDQAAGLDPAVKALREKFGFKGDTPSNAAAVLSHLSSNVMFREFRQGDVVIERWDRMDSTGERLRQALEFLYY
ncbi:secretion protein [Massilia sp. DWR3-1-1]|uniref:secretion protein n=1 Tax=Massilia sp. DWR3-1-1 TaxID=2804559 RepID=UPI003CF8C7EE